MGFDAQPAQLCLDRAAHQEETRNIIHTPPDRYPVPGEPYLCATRHFDIDNADLRAAAEAACRGVDDDIARSVKLFYWVRDGWRYDPFAIRINSQSHVASHVLASDRGYCISKAILLCAAARAVGIPSAIGLADVTNHLTSEKLKRWMGGNTLFVNHGYSLLHVGGQWLKVVPAFNLEMCERFGVTPTEFNGSSDAIFQEFDRRQRRHMEYVADHGVWSEFPYERFARDMHEAYPVLDWERGIEDRRFSPNSVDT